MTGNETPQDQVTQYIHHLIMNLPPVEMQELAAGSIGQRIDWLLEKLQRLDDNRFSRAKVASRAGISPQALWSIITGNTQQPKMETLKGLSRALHAPAGWLLSGDVEEESARAAQACLPQVPSQLQEFALAPKHQEYVLAALRAARTLQQDSLPPQLLEQAVQLLSKLDRRIRGADVGSKAN